VRDGETESWMTPKNEDMNSQKQNLSLKDIDGCPDSRGSLLEPGDDDNLYLNARLFKRTHKYSTTSVCKIKFHVANNFSELIML